MCLCAYIHTHGSRAKLKYFEGHPDSQIIPPKIRMTETTALEHPSFPDIKRKQSAQSIKYKKSA